MADKKISALTSATTPLAGTEVLPIVQGGSTVKVAVSNLTAGRAVDVASLTATGNVAAGTTLNAWVDDNVFQLPQGAISSGYGYFLSVTSNAYRSASNVWKYTTGQAPSQFIVGQSSFTWRLASTGTANTAISWTQVWSMDSTGNLTPAVAAKGINFTANTPAAGMTSQLLNWYEEGTWTVAWTSVTGTPSNLTGYYTRVGRLVTFSYAAGLTSLTGVGGTTRFSLPIPPAQYSAGSVASQLGTVTGSLEIDAGDLKAYPTSFTSGYMVFAGSYIA